MVKQEPYGTQAAAPADHVARIQAEWARERPDVDVAPQGVIGRLHRLGLLLTDRLCLVYRRYGLSEGSSTYWPRCAARANRTSGRPVNWPCTPW